VSDLEPFIRFWHALDDAFERVEPAWLGAVVTDRRFPVIWDVNYARVESDDPSLTLAEIDRSLLPALEASDAHYRHLVLLRPDVATDLLSELGTRGDQLSWDTVMEHRGRRLPRLGDTDVEEIADPDERFWSRQRESLVEFRVSESKAQEQLLRLEREVLLPFGKRWFGIRDGAQLVALGSLMSHDGIGYVDHVVTFPEARARGFASAIVARIVHDAREAGDDRVYLLAESGTGPIPLYQRLGFRAVGQVASSLAPV